MTPGGSRRSDYDEWHRAIADEAADRPPWFRLFLEHVDVEVELAGARILEAGCGRGDAAIGVAEKVGRGVLAGDFSLSATAIGRNRESRQSLPTRIQWYCGDAQELPLADACVDWILCFETVEHLPDPTKAIREFARVLRPRGRLVLTTPNYLNFAGLYRLYLRLSGRRFSEAGQPVNRFTSVPRTFFWLWRAGFRVLKFDGRSHFVPIGSGRPAMELPFLDRVPWISRWFAIQTFFLVEMPARRLSRA